MSKFRRFAATLLGATLSVAATSAQAQQQPRTLRIAMTASRFNWGLTVFGPRLLSALRHQGSILPAGV